MKTLPRTPAHCEDRFDPLSDCLAQLQHVAAQLQQCSISTRSDRSTAPIDPGAFDPHALLQCVPHLDQMLQAQRFLTRQWCFEYLVTALHTCHSVWQLSCSLDTHDTWCLDQSAVLWNVPSAASAKPDPLCSLRQFHLPQNPQGSKTFFHFMNAHSALIARLAHCEALRKAPHELAHLYERIYEHYIDPNDALVWIGKEHIAVVERLFFTDAERAVRERCTIDSCAHTPPAVPSNPHPIRRL